jgi:hypothetical protein
MIGHSAERRAGMLPATRAILLRSSMHSEESSRAY